MTSWRVRIPFIVVVAVLVATLLPGIRERRPGQLLRAPDGGSIVIALFVAIAIARVFVTLDRRRRTKHDRPAE